jgi:hypothetical protein
MASGSRNRTIASLQHPQALLEPSSCVDEDVVRFVAVFTDFKIQFANEYLARR